LAITVSQEDPRTAGGARLVAMLDEYMGGLYPAESNHLLPLDQLARPNVTFLVALLDGEPAGCGALVAHPQGYGEIKRIFTDPAHRGKGVGRSILTALVETADAGGLDSVRLETGTRQPEALALFRTFGFIECGVFGDYPADDPLSVFMAKSLGVDA
jgi:putative acetyltransferase